MRFVQLDLAHTGQDSSILRLSSIEPRLMCGGCLVCLRLSSIEPRLMCGGCLVCWHPVNYQRVSRSDCSCCVASLHALNERRAEDSNGATVCVCVCVWWLDGGDDVKRYGGGGISQHHRLLSTQLHPAHSNGLNHSLTTDVDNDSAWCHPGLTR